LLTRKKGAIMAKAPAVQEPSTQIALFEDYKSSI
jgi:hypothetical protein